MDASQEIEEYPSDRGQVVPRPRGIRSRITNGSKMLPDVDGRSTIARRYRDISSATVADQGGIDQCSLHPCCFPAISLASPELEELLPKTKSREKLARLQGNSRDANGSDAGIMELGQWCCDVDSGSVFEAFVIRNRSDLTSITGVFFDLLAGIHGHPLGQSPNGCAFG